MNGQWGKPIREKQFVKMIYIIEEKLPGQILDQFLYFIQNFITLLSVFQIISSNFFCIKLTVELII
jgi:hypothetical protein